MKTYAGNLYLDLPGLWHDSCNYCYRRSGDDEIEVRVERTPVVSVSTPLSRLDSIRERMRMLQPDLAMPHEDVVVGGFEGVTMRTPISREGDREVTLMFVLCFKPTPEICITITAFGAEQHGTSFRSACDSILNNSKIVEVR